MFDKRSTSMLSRKYFHEKECSLVNYKLLGQKMSHLVKYREQIIIYLLKLVKEQCL